MRQQVIILGSRGFLGQCLYENFLRDQDYDTVGLSISEFDLTSRESIVYLRSILRGDSIVIMSASAINKDKSVTAFQKEIVMMANLADSDLLSRIGHLILLSSTAVYGHVSESVITESSPFNPDDLYSSSKYISELVLGFSCKKIGTGLTIVRPGILYGHKDIRSPLYRFIKMVGSGRPLEIHGDGSTRLVWLHKLDAWRAIKSIVINRKFGDYNIISDGRGTSLIELAEIIFEACGKNTGIKYIPSAKVSPSLRFDLSKFDSDFPGFEFIPLRKGVLDYFTEYP